MTPSYASNTMRPEQNAAVGAFVCGIIDGQIHGYCSMGVHHEGKLVAGTLFHNWRREAGVVEMTSGATDRRWLTRPVIRAIFHMAFDLIGAQLAVMRVSERNTDMVAIAQRFGFQGVLIPRLLGRDEAEWVFTLTVENYRASRFG